MNGIEKITDRISEDAQKRVQDILDDAGTQAQSVTDNYARHAQTIRDELLAQAEDQVMLRVQRGRDAGALEGRKEQLRVKQELLRTAFDRALEQLRALPQAEYTALLVSLLVKAAPGGKGEVVFNPADRAKVGKEVVTGANEALAKAAAPKLPQELTQGKLGSILEGAATTVNAIAKGTAQLTLSQETRDIRGGFVLKSGLVEVNCALETLVEQEKEALYPEVAALLFPAR